MSDAATPDAVQRGSDNASMVAVPAGDFLMGTTDQQAEDVIQELKNVCSRCPTDHTNSEKPQHRVFLNAFWIDLYEVTNRQYTQCVEAGRCQVPRHSSSSARSSYYDNIQYANYPVIYVRWNDARNYCEWAGKRLPTEA